MYIFINEASDLKIMDHINKGDLVACMTAFRGVHNTLKDDPDFLSRLFGRKYPGGEWFDEDDRLHLPDAYDKPGYYQQIKQKVAHLNHQRNNKLKFQWLKKFQYSYVEAEGHFVEGGEPVTEDTLVIFAEPDREVQLRGFLRHACKYFGQISVLLVKNRVAYEINASGESEKIGAFHLRPKVLGQCYSVIKGKPFRFGDVKDSFRGYRSFDEIAAARRFCANYDVLNEALQQKKNYFEYQDERERAFKRTYIDVMIDMLRRRQA